MMCRCNVISQALGGVRKRSEVWRCSKSSHSVCSRVQATLRDGSGFEVVLDLGCKIKENKV